MKKNAFPPVVNQFSTRLILGSMPGETSLRHREYYAHPRNAFWPIMADIFRFDHNLPYHEKIKILLSNGIALWDVLAACCRNGSLDADIKSPESNNLHDFLTRYAAIKTIYCNGTTAYRFFNKFTPITSKNQHNVICLPSTSPANAKLTLREKRQKWHIITSPSN